MSAAPTSEKKVKTTFHCSLVGASDVSSTLCNVASYNAYRPLALYNLLTTFVIGFVFLVPYVGSAYVNNDVSYVTQIPQHTFSVEVYPSDLVNCVATNPLIDRFGVVYWTDNYANGPFIENEILFASFTSTTTIEYTPSLLIDYSEIDIGCFNATVGASVIFVQEFAQQYGIDSGSYYGAFYLSNATSGSTASSTSEEIQSLSQIAFNASVIFFISVLATLWIAKILM